MESKLEPCRHVHSWRATYPTPHDRRCACGKAAWWSCGCGDRRCKIHVPRNTRKGERKP